MILPAAQAYAPFASNSAASRPPNSRCSSALSVQGHFTWGYGSIPALFKFSAFSFLTAIRSCIGSIASSQTNNHIVIERACYDAFSDLANLAVAVYEGKTIHVGSLLQYAPHHTRSFGGFNDHLCPLSLQTFQFLL